MLWHSKGGQLPGSSYILCVHVVALRRALELLQSLLDNGSPNEVAALVPVCLPVLERLVQALAASAAAAQSDDWEAEERMGTDQQLPTEAGATYALNCLDVGPLCTSSYADTQLSRSPGSSTNACQAHLKPVHVNPTPQVQSQPHCASDVVVSDAIPMPVSIFAAHYDSAFTIRE